MQNLKDFLSKNWLFIVLFVVTTLFFIYQKVNVLSWDFGTYVMNGKYWFANGFYFEPFRPPLASFLLGVLGFIFSFPVGEILFIILVSALFFYSCLRLSKNLHFNPVLFILIFLTPFCLFYSLVNGTELLSVSLLMLGISFILENNVFSGIFIALSGLSRYTFLVFGVLLLFHKSFKKIISSIGLFVLTLIPWFVYNFYKFGNFFTSIADQYAQNVLFRMEMIQAPNILHFLEIQSFLFPFLFVGLFVLFKTIFKKDVSNKKVNILMLFIFVFGIFNYFTTPFKEARYLFILTLPLAYFTYLGFDYFLSKHKKVNGFIQKHFSVLAIIFLGVNLIIPVYASQPDGFKESYISLSPQLLEKDVFSCQTVSNQWVLLDYLGQPSEPFGIQHLEYYCDTNKVLFLYKWNKDVQDTLKIIKENPQKYPIILENERFLVVGSVDFCQKAGVYDLPFIESSSINAKRLYNKEINTNPCTVLFFNYPFLEKTCNFLNYGEYKLSENRLIVP
ncbi:MAG TPA: hypothetical protein P5513_01450 [Candidatus Diapherotrites archaeon]|nr:hypothetical protein [Candidatus Diapherotrites archaeon]